MSDITGMNLDIDLPHIPERGAVILKPYVLSMTYYDVDFLRRKFESQ